MSRWRRPALMFLGLLVITAAVPTGFHLAAASREVEVATEVAPGRFVTAHDVDMHVQVYGDSGPVVVLIPGTSAWSGVWRDTTTALVEGGYRVVALDLPPFGFSARPTDASYSRQDQAARIIGVTDALNIEQYVLMGHSFGGGATVQAAMQAPERTQALVLANVALGLQTSDAARWGPSGLMARTPFLRDALVAATLTNPGFTRRGLTFFVHDPAAATPDRVALYQAPLRVQGTTREVGRWVPELLWSTPADSLDPEAYRRLEVPTLLVWGTNDTVTPLSQGEHVHGLLPDSSLQMLPGVGHIPQIEDVGRFNDAVLEFLDKVTAPPPPPPLPTDGPFHRELLPGLTLAAYDPPPVDDIGFSRPPPEAVGGIDRRLFVVTVDPARFEVVYRSMLDPNVGGDGRTASEWADDHGLLVAFNPGMFEEDGRATGYTRAGRFVSQPDVRRNKLYDTFFVAEPLAGYVHRPPAGKGRYGAYDELPTAFKSTLEGHGIVSQSLSILERGVAAYPPRKNHWSELTYGTDKQGRLLVIFSRYPYEMRELGHRIAALPIAADSLLHGEGGPEATLVVRAGGVELVRVGSYETGFYDDRNREEWHLPAVMGVRPRSED